MTSPRDTRRERLANIARSNMEISNIKYHFGMFGNVLVSFFTEHIKEGRGEYPAKSLSALKTKLLEYTFNTEILSENNTLHKNSFSLALEVILFPVATTHFSRSSKIPSHN